MLLLLLRFFLLFHNLIAEFAAHVERSSSIVKRLGTLSKQWGKHERIWSSHHQNDLVSKMKMVQLTSFRPFIRSFQREIGLVHSLSQK